jgi:hypothetical protein
MTQSIRHHLAFYALLSAAAALSWAPESHAQAEQETTPAVQPEEAPNLNVIVNDSALDNLPYGTEDVPLPPPDKRPISRLLISPDGRIIGTSDLSSSPEATVSAVPTTPIMSSELDAFGTESAPAEDAAAEASPSFTVGEAPAEETTTDEAASEGSTAAASTAEETAATETPSEGTAAAETAAEETAAAATTADEPAAGEQALTSETTEGLLEGQLRIPFEEESKLIPETVKGQIVGLIERMNNDYGLHLQVLAYASGDDDEIGHARGVSLARALEMRNFLSENGLDLSRMDVRALGNTAQEDPADRVDLIPLVQ